MKISWCLFIPVVVVLFWGTNAQAQDPETKKEIWPEIDLFIPLNERFRLLLSNSSEKSSETRDGIEGQVGAYVDYFLKDRITLRAGYRYGYSLGATDPFAEHRITVDQTFHKPLPRSFVLTDRNRQEFRSVNDDFSLRLRNRITIEKSFPVRKISLVPYNSNEIFYDSRFSSVSRFQFALGTQILFAKREYWFINLRRQRVLDVYYLWQRDRRPETKSLHAIGVTFEIHF